MDQSIPLSGHPPLKDRAAHRGIGRDGIGIRANLVIIKDTLSRSFSQPQG